MDDVWDSEPESGGGLLSWLAGGVGMLGAVALVLFISTCCCCGYGWESFVQFGIGEDLADFRVAIRGSDLLDEEKAFYVRRLEVLEDQLDAGELDVSFMDWVGVSGDVEEILDDRQVSSVERPQLEEALRQMERWAR